jgi:hypothetical protein
VSVPAVLVELDTGGLLNGARLDDPTSAQLDTAVLEYSTPTYVNDISAYVRGGDTDRGAQRELQQVQAGTGSLVLDNQDGRFTPFLSSSPYYPNILPMRRIRIQAVWNAVTYPVFQGFVESWPVSFPEDVDQVTTVQLVDGFKLLSLANVSGSFPQQSSGARIADVLSAVSWPSPETDLDTGVVDVPSVTLDNASALEHIQQIEHAEGGRFFMSKDGKATFRDRTAQANPDFSDRTWADDGSGMPYRTVVPICDDDLILNDVHMTRTGGTEQISTDVTSQNTYGIRSSSETGIQLTTDADVLALADLMVERYKDPVQRLESLVDNAMAHGLWDQVLSRELNDIALAKESRTQTSQVSTIEGISHSLERDGSWTVTLALSPTVVVQAGILDDATYGLLDSTAILAR